MYFNIWLIQALASCISAGVAAQKLVPVSIIVITLMFAFQGFLVPLEKIPVWIRWISVIDPVKYYFELILNLVFTNMPGSPVITYECAVQSAFLSCAVDGPGFISQSDALDFFGIPSTPSSKINAFLIMLAWLVALKILGYLLLRHRLIKFL
eukprot:gb/GEZN01027410.1/.p1 GENE.gb/GEZN01027410.1/~~gb/GEZN01027410.1/.p1  ORF type:complete len:164 (-),score=7.84 gb/GEZN01027410.1/:12-467(-)